jgi:predicted phosphoribosyltransferase
VAVGEYYEDFAPVTDEAAIATVFRQPRMETR